MIKVTDEVQHLVTFFQNGFTILIALALGEALCQFVAADIRHPDDKAIQWNRLPALLIFLFLILPFFQGMNRYFYLTCLKTGSLPYNYPIWLAIDGLAFVSALGCLIFESGRGRSFRLILRSRAQRGVSKDEAARASWFETRPAAAPHHEEKDEMLASASAISTTTPDRSGRR